MNSGEKPNLKEAGLPETYEGYVTFMAKNGHEGDQITLLVRQERTTCAPSFVQITLVQIC
eukprot:49303-Pyramimonas_sp.AAC.1